MGKAKHLAKFWQTISIDRPMRLVCGSICYDLLLQFARRNGEKKHKVLSRTERVGGGAANLAIGQKRLAPDRQLLLFGAVGSDVFGDEIRSQLANEEIETPWAPIPDGRTSLSVVAAEGESAESDAYCDSGVRAAEMPLELIELAAAPAEAMFLVHPGVNDQIPDLVTIADDHQVPVFFGIGRTQIAGLGYQGLRRALVREVKLVICNRAEAGKLTGKSDIAAQLDALRFEGKARIAVITDGANGIYACSDVRILHQPAYIDHSRDNVNDIGAGDAAHGAIADALLRGYSLDVALEAGTRQGFEATTGAGATSSLIGRAEMDKHLERLPTIA